MHGIPAGSSKMPECVGFGSPAVAVVGGIDACEITGTLWDGLISVERVGGDPGCCCVVTSGFRSSCCRCCCCCCCCGRVVTDVNV